MKVQLFFMMVLCISMVQAQKFQKIKITDGVSVMLPESLRPMTDIEIATKYVSYRSALAFFTDDREQQADFIVNTSVTPWSENDFEMLQGLYKASIFNLYDEVDLLREEIRVVNNKKMILFEFISTVKDEENTMVQRGSIRSYQYIAYALKDGDVLIFTFSCPERKMKDWQEAAGKIIDGIKVK